MTPPCALQGTVWSACTQLRYEGYLCIGGVVDVQKLVHRPVEPAHEEDAQGQAVGDQHQRGVVPKPARVDVPDHVVLKDGHAVVDVRAGLPIWEAVEEPAEPQALCLLPLFPLSILHKGTS